MKGLVREMRILAGELISRLSDGGEVEDWWICMRLRSIIFLAHELEVSVRRGED